MMPSFHRFGRKVKEFFRGEPGRERPLVVRGGDDQAECSEGTGGGLAPTSDKHSAEASIPIPGPSADAATTSTPFTVEPANRLAERTDESHRVTPPPDIIEHREVDATAQELPHQGPSSPPSWPTTPGTSPLSSPSLSIPTHSYQGQLQVPPSTPPALLGTNHFPHAHDFNISNLSIDNRSQNFAYPKTVFEYLEPHISHGAAHDSDERCDAPKCASETREAVQEDIVSFIAHGDEGQSSKKIMWLGGPAGSGKTAIAGSVAETCEKRGLTAATFFFSSFSGSADRRLKRFVVPTLANHLAEHDALHQYQAQLLLAIERNPRIFRKRLMDQAQCLILGPLRAIQGHCDTSTWPKGVLIDGLDEVQAEQYHDATKGDPRTDEDDQLEILNVLITLANSPAFPFRIFVASRPERVITEFFATTAASSTVSLFLDAKYDPDADIERFLWSKFAEIRRRYGISNASWPKKKVVDRIVEMSSGQFVVPATIIRFISVGPPMRHLEDVLRVEWEVTEKSPFAIVDALYAHILNRSPDPHMAVNWIGCFSSFDERQIGGKRRPASAFFWRHFLEDSEGEFYHILMPLTSLFSIPSPEDTTTPIVLYHKSLTDFLSSEVRSGKLYVGEEAWTSFAAGRCVKVLKNKGPTVSLPPEYDVSKFVVLFLSLCPLVIPSYFGMEGQKLSEFCNFVVHLSPESKTELLSCNSAWWTCRFLTEPSDIATALWYDRKDRSAMRYIGAIYCMIHSALCDTSSPDSPCHPACTHWRTEILKEARVLGWPANDLETMDISQLSDLTKGQFQEKLGKRDNAVSTTGEQNGG
ncbi:hypothetical protein NMY22_g7335 [Coprinellus aureogranulatus]|nr:hypothetical protein NMY22_g7335 [Coprinellus aureogranulatus]